MIYSFPASKSVISNLFIVLFVILVYLPLMLKGGIITDDWGDILESLGCSSFWQCYGDWFPLFSNRPLAPLPITLSTRLFGINYSWYLWVNSAIYLASLIITVRAVAPFLGIFARQVFFVLAAVPFIAMPVIVSPINQLTATVAFLYWAISLAVLLRYCHTNQRFWFFISYGFLLCGFLTYEIILPLLFFTAFLPALLQPKSITKQGFTYCLKFIVPITAVLLMVIIWQKLLAPHFMEVYSRLNFQPDHLTRNLFTWIHLFLVQIPDLFIKSIGYFSFEAIAIGVLVVGIFWGGASQIKRLNISLDRATVNTGLGFFLISTGALLASSLIFILTDESAVSWGYQARGLSSTWFALAIWLAAIIQLTIFLPKLLRTIIFLCLILFTSFSALSFTIQRDKYIKSWSLQLGILNDINVLMTEKAVGLNPSLIANVPRYVPNNYNRELVFSQSWDLPAAINITSPHRLQSGIVIDAKGADLQGLRIENEKVIVNDGGQVNFTNLWLYDFDSKSQKGTLTHLENPSALEKWLRQQSKN